MITLSGRIFSSDVLAQIRAVIDSRPLISRRKLSADVCEFMQWRNGAGRLQVMSCRKALLELERRGVIELPQVRARFGFTQRKPQEPPPLAVVECSLGELGEVKLVRVAGGSQLSRLWHSMMDAHHYLKSGPLCGAQLRYLVHSERCGWLGGLSYSACARRVACRDEWIGWSQDARLCNQALVVNNSRFLIAPSVRVKCLASHVLSLCRKVLARDWESVYGYRPVLLETYVERGRFAGTCYRAANWLYIGKTCGLGRDGKGAATKDVFLMPLHKRWQSEVCRCHDGVVRISSGTPERAPRTWIETELGNAMMGDARLTARLLKMTGMFFDKPSANIPQACGSIKAAKAAYRFLDNPSVEWTQILASHYAATEERLREHSVVLAVQDSTSLNHNTHPHTQGLGPIGSGRDGYLGLMVHETMAFAPDGAPLGLLDVQCWARTQVGSRHKAHDKPIEEKESIKWLRGFDATTAVQRRLRKTTLVMVADREADIYDLFARQSSTDGGAQLLIRAERTRNRQTHKQDNVEETQLLWPLLGQEKVIATRDVLLAPNEKRGARQATLELRAKAVTLAPPKRSAHLPSVKLWAVLAREPQPPCGIEPLEWMLLTTIKTQTQTEVCRLLQWYTRRWQIEVFHRILKSGCQAEARQLENAQRLLNCLAIDMIVGWRIQLLAFLGHEAPDIACTVYFTDSEWKALTTFTTGTKTPPAVVPSLNQAVALLGRLGGHMGRTGDGHPGSEVLWRAMARLADIEAAYSLYH